MKRVKRANGGAAKAKVIFGNPNVIDSARKRKSGGRVNDAGADIPTPKFVGFMTGGAVKSRMDRPGRKRASGGRVGSDKSPFSSANATMAAEKTPAPTDTYGGMPDE